MLQFWMLIIIILSTIGCITQREDVEACRMSAVKFVMNSLDKDRNLSLETHALYPVTLDTVSREKLKNGEQNVFGSFDIYTGSYFFIKNTTFKKLYYDSLFEKEDEPFIYEQVNEITNSSSINSWAQSELERQKVTRFLDAPCWINIDTMIVAESDSVSFDKKFDWNCFVTKHGEGFISISMPIFNNSLTKCIVSYDITKQTESQFGFMVLTRKGTSWHIKDNIWLLLGIVNESAQTLSKNGDIYNEYVILSIPE